MSRDTEELEQLRLALAELQTSAQRMDEVSKSLRDVSDLLERLLKIGPVDADGLDRYSNSNRYVYEDTLVSHEPLENIPKMTPPPRAQDLDTDL